MPVEELKAHAIQDYDTDSAKLYDDVVSCTQHKYILGYTLKTLAGDVTKLRCLDAGCGNGEYMRHFYANGASFCAGVDLSKENLDIAAANHKVFGVPKDSMSYTQADLTKPKPISTEQFDLAVSNAVVCYASSQDELLGFMSFAHVNLKPGGRFIVINTRQALPLAARDELQNLVGVRYDVQPEEAFSPMVGEWPNGWKGYCNYIPAENVEKALKDAGFSVEQRDLLVDPDADAGVDLKRVAELVPYNVFVATKPTESDNHAPCTVM